MRSFSPRTTPSRIRTWSAPSPSTRASVSTLRVRVLASLIRLALAAEGSRRGVVGAEHVPDLLPRGALLRQPAGEARRIRRLNRAEAAVAAAAERRTQVAAAGLRHRTQAGDAARHHDADRARALALDALAVVRDVRRPIVEKRVQHLDQLALVDRAAAQLEVDDAVVGDRGRMDQRLDEFGPRVDGLHPVLDAGEVAQRLD